MKNKKKIIAIIPARSGSKRIRNKNIKKLNGYPIISHVIKVLRKTKIFSSIVVTTDSKEITKISTKAGAVAPFTREKKISNDTTDLITVVKDAIKKLKKKNWDLEYICVVLPTSIFNKKKNIEDGLKLLKTKKYDFVFSAKVIDNKILRGFYKKKNYISMIFKKNYEFRTQDLPVVYVDAAQFYWGEVSTWLKRNKIFTDKSTFIDLSKEKTIDIDTPKDFLIAKKIYNKKVI